MKIAFLSQYFHPETFSNNQIARDLVARGHEVHVVSCVPNYPAGSFFPGYSNTDRREETWEGVAIHRARTKARGRSALSLMANYLVYPFAASWTLWRKMPGRADVSFVSMPSPLTQALAGIWLRWRTGTPCVIWVQDIWPESAIHTLGLTNPLIVRPLTWLCGWIYRRADLVLVQSRAFPAMIERFGVPPERIRFFPNTAPEDHRPLTPEDAPAEGTLVAGGKDQVREGGRADRTFRLMFAGNIGESQDFDTLIAAADLLRDAPLVWVIVGSGRDEARVHAEIAARGLDDRFRFLGRHPSERMPFFFAHADAMLVSLKDTPIFALTVPYKVQGYMACARPIVAALTGEGARIVEDAGAGVSAPAGDAPALIGAIRQMLAATPDERAHMGRAGRAFFERNYAPGKVMDDLEAWLGAVADGRAVPAESRERVLGSEEAEMASEIAPGVSSDQLR